jgi:hypothetical protein
LKPFPAHTTFDAFLEAFFQQQKGLQAGGGLSDSFLRMGLDSLVEDGNLDLIKEVLDKRSGKRDNHHPDLRKPKYGFFENIKSLVGEDPVGRLSDSVSPYAETAGDAAKDGFLKIKSLIGFNSGGAVNGPGTGTSDDIPAMLSNGEFVMKASAVQKFGPAFMEAVNAGKVPQFRSEGGVAGTFRRLNEQLGVARSENDTTGALELIASIKQLKIATEEQTLALLEGNEEERTAAAKAIVDDIPDDPRRINPKDLAISYADGFKADFASALSNALKTGDVKGFLLSVADSFTSRYIDSFVDGLTDSLFKDNKFFDKIFTGSIGLGTDTGEKLSDGIAVGVEQSEDGLMSMVTKFFGKLFKGIGDLFSGSGDGGGLFGMLGGLFGGGGDGMGGTMGGIFSLFSGGFNIGGFSQGGTVRNVPGSQAGKDSVPAMLMPGEVVLSKNQLSNMNANGGGQSQQSFNINVQGDVSRQTRQEIVKMMPQIAGGVNAQNKENNFKR